jgi:TrmH family RNA methyltransferase
MQPTLEITSPQNPRIKRVAKLAHRSSRDELGQTVVEGVREVTLALKQGIVPVEAFICREMPFDQDPAAAAVLSRLKALAGAGQTELIDVSAAVFEKIAYRGESGGLLLVVPYTHQTLDTLALPDAPLIVVVEDAEKPGNLGAILRTADAAGVDALFVPLPEHTPGGERGKGTDLHNPNVIRASLGAAFTVPQVVAPAQEMIRWLKRRGVQLVAAVPEATTRYTATDLTGPTAIVMGSEAWGLSDTWQRAADTLVNIPMAGAVDSLNLATSTALLVYEAVRQRGGPA